MKPGLLADAMMVAAVLACIILVIVLTAFGSR
jgi:hypothetical protein